MLKNLKSKLMIPIAIALLLSGGDILNPLKAKAVPSADITYTETNLNNHWEYGLTLNNTSDTNELLNSVYFYFDSMPNIEWIGFGDGWTSTLEGLGEIQTDFTDIYSQNPSKDIIKGNSLDGFLFNSDSKINNITYDAFFDGASGQQVYSGTADITNPVVPEPISSILFLAGGATLGLRNYLKKKI